MHIWALSVSVSERKRLAEYASVVIGGLSDMPAAMGQWSGRAGSSTARACRRRSWSGGRKGHRLLPFPQLLRAPLLRLPGRRAGRAGSGGHGAARLGRARGAVQV
eukprot:10364802-Alexandrium_andersonii.AAC.1